MHLTCPICCELFGASDESAVTECGHLFHLTCAVPWISEKQNCPQCRQNCSTNLLRVYFTGTTDDNVHLNTKCNADSGNNRIVTSSNSNICDNEFGNLIKAFEELQSTDESLDTSDKVKCLQSDLQISTEKIYELKSIIESLEDELSNVCADRDELIKEIEIGQSRLDNLNYVLDENTSLRAAIKFLQE